MKLSTLLWSTFFCCCLLVVTLLFAFSQYSASVSSLEALNAKQKAAHALVDQLERNRIKLTAYARRFVLNNEQRAYNKYIELQDIIKGNRARSIETLTPYLSLDNKKFVHHYVGIYTSDLALLKSQGLSKRELELLNQVFTLSNKTSSTEYQAFSLKKQHPTQAAKLLFSRDYQDTIAGMIDFLHGYQTFFEHKIDQQYQRIRKDIQHLFIFVVFILISTSVFLFCAYFIFKNNLAKPLKKLDKVTARHINNIESFTHLTTNSSIKEVKQLTGSINNIFQQIGRQIEQLKDEAKQKEKLKREAEKSNQVKSQFIANTNHEVRTPLNAVIGFSHLLQTTELNAQQQQYVQNTANAAKVLLSLFDDLSDLSNMDEGHLSITLNPCSIEEIAEYINSLIAQQCKNKYLDLQIKIDAKCPVNFATDEIRLKQILTNIANNAIKYTKTGSITVSIYPDFQQQLMCFDIQDTGTGIAAEHIERIVHPFEQADGSNTREFGGIGLGLTITQKLCRLLSGQLTIRSELNVGSTFTIKLPMLKPSKQLIKTYTVQQRSPVQVLTASSSMTVQLTRMLQLVNVKQYSIISEPADITLDDNYKHSVLFIDQLFIEGLSQQRLKQLSEHHLQICIVHEQYQPLSSLPYTLDNIHSLTAPFSPSKVARIFNLMNAQSHLSLAKPWEKIDLSGLTILLVEDAPMNQLIAQKTLENFKVTVDIADNGEIAIEKLNLSTYDLILMDLHMPVMDGFSATKHIKRQTKTQHIPILGLTADVQEVTKQKCLSIGMEDVITKPFDPVKLAKKLTKIKASQSIEVTKFL